MADTVDNALQTPDLAQPWGELGLREDEYQQIREILGRRPTGAELAMYSVMWSEHCSYKSSRIHLKRFAELDQSTPRGPLLAGMGDNAGVVDIGQGYAVTFKAESHNHPSFLEPRQGAATGVGGIVRDILAMGARPIGVMDLLRFGSLYDPDTLRVLPGVVSGVGGYGNCLGLPNIGGEAGFDQAYAGNPLVNALCVGVLRHDDLHLAIASGPGNKVIMYGAATGGDGIGGASVLASETFTADGQGKRPSVQVGDPFMEKLLIECTLELFAAKVVAGIQDFGAAGISCATSELASAGDGGMRVELDVVPLRDPSLTPEEILMSESQERMMAIVEPDKVEAFMAICDKWEVQATIIGEVTEDRRLMITWHGETIVDVDPGTVAHEGPVYQRPAERPQWLDQLNEDRAENLKRDASYDGIQTCFRQVISHPRVADQSWISDQYDRYVRGNTVLARPDDGGLLRVDEHTGLGIALALTANERYSQLNPYLGAQLSLAEAYRRVSCCGAEPVAITDCLNFGSPEDPEVMWQFAEAIRGLVEACEELGTPVTGGNVSFYNQTADTPIMPTPAVGVLGVLDNVAKHQQTGFAFKGDAVFLMGETREELSGSVWAEAVHNHLGGEPPTVDLAAEKALGRALLTCARESLLSNANSLARGGLAVALGRACLRRNMGATITLPKGDPVVQLFSESSARALVSLPATSLSRFLTVCDQEGVPLTRLGEVTGEDLEVVSVLNLPLSEIKELWSSPIPNAMA